MAIRIRWPNVVRASRKLRSYPPFHSRMMLTLLIFSYAPQTRSSRKIVQRCEQHVACRVIVLGLATIIAAWLLAELWL